MWSFGGSAGILDVRERPDEPVMSIEPPKKGAGGRLRSLRVRRPEWRERVWQETLGLEANGVLDSREHEGVGRLLLARSDRGIVFIVVCMKLYEEEAHCLDYLILSLKLNKPKPMWPSPFKVAKQQQTATYTSCFFPFHTMKILPF